MGVCLELLGAFYIKNQDKHLNLRKLKLHKSISEMLLQFSFWDIWLFQLHHLIMAGLRFAGTKDGNAQELLYKYALYFLNEV